MDASTVIVSFPRRVGERLRAGRIVAALLAASPLLAQNAGTLGLNQRSIESGGCRRTGRRAKRGHRAQRASSPQTSKASIASRPCRRAHTTSQ